MRPFVPSDLPDVNAWRAAHGLGALAPEDVPALGAIEPGVAAGFLARVEGGSALFNGLVTNPDAPLRVRRAACDAVVESLGVAAAGHGIRHILAFIGLRSTDRVAARAGYNDCGSFRLRAKRIEIGRAQSRLGPARAPGIAGVPLGKDG